MLEFVNVRKRYPGGQDALDGLSFHLSAGEFAFLTGHSGAGKSTVLKLIAGIERISSGRLLVEGNDAGRLSSRQLPAYRRRMGIIFQDNRLLNDRTVYDNVALPLIVDGHCRQREIRRRVHASLDMVGLIDHAQHRPINLSGGEQQRVGIARAIINKPPLLLADEPTGNLDPELSEEIMNLFAGLQAYGMTILVASHDIALLDRLGHRRLHLEAGRLVADRPAGGL